MNDSSPVDNPLVDEVRKLVSAVGGQAQQVLGRFRDDNPEVYQHLATAGNELLAAYRAVLAGQERRWSAPAPSDSERIDLDAEPDARPDRQDV
ncbi:DUF5304 domain-containing protein [Kitasatospora sp. RB6PN24]|uniref:DUF5304 family protein n=1 Tax=Kitasatospora humi TaxID=2893891 RepID=UPI001E60C767|nr:DUF5304 family protein [Kitasatospora humi]MCC9308757.1 DUF5304 domain-containing protein [Kitasatospora humi]